MFVLKSDAVKAAVKVLANNVRAENIGEVRYIELYAGPENIENINNKNNTVIYGRRGSGKTHLLRALSEKLLDDFDKVRIYPVYIDLRRIIPILPSGQGTPEIDAILIFKYLVQEISHSIATNLVFIYALDEFASGTQLVLKARQQELQPIFEKIYLEFDGREYKKPTALNVTEEEVSAIKGAASISQNPELSGSLEKQTKSTKETSKNTHISILDITNEIEGIIRALDLDRIVVLLDEWSEIAHGTQIYLADIIKKCFSAIPVSVKVAAIPNRTNLGIKTDQKYFGLEDGGDIFAYNLDTRYIFEVNKAQTRDFFNNLLYKHLVSIDRPTIDSLIADNKTSRDKLINLFFANAALSEILVASAGIPRDFINLFLNSYDRFLLTATDTAKRINVKNIRSANSEWYETDKKEQIDKHPIEQQLLVAIVREVIEKKKSVHFLIPDKYSRNPHIQNLIDFRVIHLRKSGYSHKDHPGVSYNVFSVDYGCYNSLSITKSQLDTSVLDELNVKELREIRRISLEESFFQKFLLNIGEAFTCPHCSKPVDTNHLAFKKQSLCNNCFETVGAPA